MHGSPLSPYNNLDLLNEYNFETFGIEGEAYLSMAGKDIQYLTDTGRNWCGKHSVRDKMPIVRAIPHRMKTTDDLIRWIRMDGAGDIYLTVHPERWALGKGEWLIGYMKDIVINVGKNFIAAIRQ